MQKNKSKEIKLKSIEVDKLERTLDKGLTWFFAYPKTKIGLNELSKYIKSSKTATKKVVEDLIEVKFLNKEVIGKAWLISANPKHFYFTTNKISYNLQKVYESEIINAVYEVIQSPRAIILFGSYRWGTDIEESDIDIAVEVIGNDEMKIIQLGIIKELGYRKNISVNLHIFSRNKIDLNLFANVANGIVLDGFLEVRI